jgi:hypothetical protein
MLELSRASGCGLSSQPEKAVRHSSGGQTPLRVAGHDVALAQRKTTGIERLIDRPGKGQEGFAQA